MPAIRLIVEGEHAVDASRNLQEIQELTATVEPIVEEHKEIALATIVSIVAMTAGAVTVADKLIIWYRDWKKGKDEKRIEKVIIEGPDGTRVLMENAKPEDVAAILAAVPNQLPE
ncbi:MAG: hypothetical protein HY774_03405 [Acidobacteria bacterium]|nr:hypothetical protein [Acidobacteriota bacterium]